MRRSFFIQIAFWVACGTAWGTCAPEDHSCRSSGLAGQGPGNGRSELSNNEWAQIRRPFEIRRTLAAETAHEQDISKLANTFNVISRHGASSFDEEVRLLLSKDVNRIEFKARELVLARALERARSLDLGQRQRVLDLYARDQGRRDNGASRLSLIQMAGSGDAGMLDSALRGFSGTPPQPAAPIAPVRGFRAFPRR